MVKPLENLRKRKMTGGRRRAHRGKRQYERDRYPTEMIVGARQVTSRQARGGSRKIGLPRENSANVIDQGTGQTKKAKIIRVISNPASRDYTRRRVLTKGAIIETESGRARVVSRPSQDGVVNAILLK